MRGKKVVDNYFDGTKFKNLVNIEISIFYKVYFYKSNAIAKQ